MSAIEEKYKSFIKRAKLDICICPKCMNLFNSNIPCECGYTYQAGRVYDNIDPITWKRVDNQNKIIHFETKTYDFLNRLNEIDWERIHDYFILTNWQYYKEKEEPIIPTIEILQDTVKKLYNSLRFSTCTSGVSSGGFTITKTEDGNVILEFHECAIYENGY